jgi:hypothetical protein
MENATSKMGMERHRKNNTTDKLALVLNGYKVIG